MTSGPDHIRLAGLRVRGFHGVFDFERRDGQDFVVDVDLEVPDNRADARDDLKAQVVKLSRSTDRRIGFSYTTPAVKSGEHLARALGRGTMLGRGEVELERWS